MALYTNGSRHSAIVTIKVNSSQDLKAAIKVGIPEAQSARDVQLGHNDVAVQAGESLELSDGTDAVFIAVRSGE